MTEFNPPFPHSMLFRARRLNTFCIKSRPGFSAVRHFTTWCSSPLRLQVYHTTGIRREQPPGGVGEMASAVRGYNRITKTCRFMLSEQVSRRYFDYITFFPAKVFSCVSFRVLFLFIFKSYSKPLRVTINTPGELVFFLS